jgi:hypothetical protein
MSKPSRRCPRTEVEHVRKLLTYAKRQLDETRYYPPITAYRFLVALALYSKCLTVSEATLVLIDAGFGDEAFGMTRTLIDIFITMQYLANKDTEERAKLYYQFHRKDIDDWAEEIRSYWPQLLQGVNPRPSKVHTNYPRPHSWSGKPLGHMILEPDTVEVDAATGQPFVHNLTYRMFYRWTSHYVHPTILALDNHMVKPGRDNFVVRSRRGKDMGHLAAFTVAAHIASTMICFYRCMGDPQPDHLSKWMKALIEHLARRHQ